MSPVTTTRIDDRLVTSSVAGDPRAREDLARACLPLVWRIVYLSGGGGADAEDIAQTALTRAFADLARFSGRGSFTTWLYRVTLNTVREHYRRGAVRRVVRLSERLDEHPAGGAADPEAGASGGELLERLAHHLAAIGERKRTAVVLSLVEGYTAAEIALVTGCSAESAKKRLYRGRKELVDRLSRDAVCAPWLEENVR